MLKLVIIKIVVLSFRPSSGSAEPADSFPPFRVGLVFFPVAAGHERSAAASGSADKLRQHLHRGSLDLHIGRVELGVEDSPTWWH